MKFFFSVKPNRKRGIHAEKRYNIFHHLREWLWPSMGWLGLARWMEIKMKRTPGSAHKVALGFACGAFISFTPFMGLHILLGAVIARILGGSLWISALGTIVGNPWTFPFIWAWCYKFGNFVLGVENHIAFSEVIGNIKDINSFETLWENIDFYWETIILPMVIGGVPTGILVGLIFYWAIRFNIESWRKAREVHMKIKRKMHAKKRKKAASMAISKLKKRGK